MNEHDTQPTPEACEAEPRDGPRIYVASLSDYNAGILHGRWIDVVADVQTMQEEIVAMLAASPTMARYGDLAEEWAIHDYENFGDIRVGEYQGLDAIAGWATGLEKHGLAFAVWIAHVADQGSDSIEQFEDRYQGKWESVTAYAEHMLDELDAERVVADAPQWLQPYLKVDVEGFARDLELGGDIVTAEKTDGGVWVWSGW